MNKMLMISELNAVRSCGMKFADYETWLGIKTTPGAKHGYTVREEFRKTLLKLAGTRTWGSHNPMTDLHYVVLRDMITKQMMEDPGYEVKYPHARVFRDVVNHFVPEVNFHGEWLVYSPRGVAKYRGKLTTSN